MDAETFIDSICESPRDVVFAYIPGMTTYGIGTPPRRNEDPFVTWLKSFFKREGQSMAQKYRRDAMARPDEFIDLLITQFDALFIVVLNGFVDVYSFRQHAKKIPKEFLEKVQRFLDIDPHTNVGWFQSVNANPVSTVAAEPIFGQEPEDVSVEKHRGAAMQKMMSKKELSPNERKELRRKFWSPGGFDPSTAPDIVDKLLP